jgi:multiple sugar transport system substrate-binding protein
MVRAKQSAVRISRRTLLKGAALSGLGLAGLHFPHRVGAATNPTTVRFAGWAFEPQVVEANVKRFMDQNPDIKVEYEPLDLQLYNEKMVALFNAGTQPDAYYVRDTNLGAWVEAGWLQPIDGLPGLAELDADIFPFNLEALKYKGKQYGTPYYGDVYVYMYDKKALQKVGISKPPVTLDQLRDAALAVKKAGLAEYPILKGFKTNVDGLSEFWSMVFASGGNLFDEEMNPVYPEKDKTGLSVLEWMVSAIYDWKILDPKGLELDETQARDAFVNGQGFFTSNVGNVLPRANNPQHSNRAGDIAPTRFPGLTDVGKGPMGWTRLYCIDAKTKVRDAAWRVIYYMGGKDKSGAYYTAKDWYVKYGVGYAFKSLDKDPDMIKQHRAAGWDLNVRSQQYGAARARQNITATWYNEWDRFTQQQIQNALVKKLSPRDALTASANKARDLKKQWG